MQTWKYRVSQCADFFNPDKNNIMYNKVILFFFCICMLQVFVKAEDSNTCTAAKDSVKAQLGRGEMAFYLPSKTNPTLYNYIRISKNFYQKTPVRMSQGSKDTTLFGKNKAYGEAYENKTDKSQPLDTSNEYKKCYNKAFQPRLDSVFKCDFFKKADSILMIYDKMGKGYSGVEFPGGPGALQKFMDKNVSLPKNVKPNDSTDKAYRVYYSFFVDEKGALSDVNLVKSNCKDCEALVLDAIGKLPAFIPAKDAGKPKKVKYILPFIKAYVNSSISVIKPKIKQ